MVVPRANGQHKSLNASPKILALSISALLLLTSCGGNKQVRFSSPFREDDELTASIAFKVVEKAYRIKPDRRYISALSSISEIITGKRLDKVEAVFDDGIWHIKADKVEVSQVKDFATFPDLCNSLTKFARSLEGEQGERRFQSRGKKVINHSKVFGGFQTELDLVREEKNPNWTKDEPAAISTAEKPEQEISPDKTDDNAEPSGQIDRLLLDYSPNALFKAIEQVNIQWKEGGASTELIDQAATALTGLAFQTYDQAGTGDDLFARALAFTCLSRRYETENAKRNQVRLAEAMGYRSDAKKFAADLPEEDPLRMYMLWQAQTVGAAVEQGLNTNESKFLYLKKLAVQENLVRLKEYFKGRFDGNTPFSLSAYGCLQPLKKNDQLNAESPSFEDILFYQLKEITGENVDAQESFFAKLDKHFKKLQDQSDRLIPQSVIADFYRSFAYSFVIDYLQPDNGSYTEKEAEKIFDLRFGKPSSSEPGSSICTLAHSILDSRSGHYQVAKLLGNAVGPKDLGDYPRFLAFDEAARFFANGDPKLISAGKTIFENLDSRPQNRFRVASIAHNQLLHPILALNLNSLALDADGDGMFSVQAARQNTDQMLLRRIADNKIAVPSYRAGAMAALASFTGRNDPGTRDVYVDRIEELVEHTPGNVEVLRQYVQTSILAGSTAMAIENTKNWIEKSSGFEKPVEIARQLLGELYCSNGNAKEAVKLLDGKLDNKVDVQIAQVYVSALAQTGRQAKADAFADSFYVANRLSPRALALKTQTLWAKRAYTEAALVLKSYPWFLKEEIWRRDIYPSFKVTLSGLPQESKNAARALSKEGFAESTNIGELAQSSSFHGRNDTAFDILNAVLSSSFSGHELNYLNLSTMAYKFLEESQSQTIALRWIQEKVPPQFFTPLAMFAFQNGAYDLLWKLIPEDPQGVGAEYVWLTRAAAMPMQKSLNRDANRLLIQHFAKDGDDALFQIGKCLIGAVDSKTMMDKRINVRELCDLSYFLGARETYLGDQTAAAQWYHMALETGVNKAGESARNAEAIRRLTNFYPDWSDRK